MVLKGESNNDPKTQKCPLFSEIFEVLMDFIAKLKTLANNGSGIACFEVAHRLWQQAKTNRDVEDAFAFLSRGMELGNHLCFYQAYLWAAANSLPHEVPKDQIVEWLKKGAEFGHQRSKLALAKFLIAQLDRSDEAIPLLSKLEDAGVAEARFLLESLNVFDGRLPLGPFVHASGLEREHERGNRHASFALGLDFQFGFLHTPNPEKARSFFSHARSVVGIGVYLQQLREMFTVEVGQEEVTALLFRDWEASYAPASFALVQSVKKTDPSFEVPDARLKQIFGLALCGNLSAVEFIGYNPTIIPPEVPLSLEQWQEFAARSGDASIAQAVLAELAVGDTASQHFENLRRCAEAGSAIGYRNYGAHLLASDHGEEAVPWLYMAFCEGDLNAGHILGNHLCSNGKTHNERLAGFEILKSYSDLGYSFALAEVSKILEFGLVGPKNIPASNEFLRLAASRGSEQAIFRLGCKLAEGADMKKDQLAADHWFNRSFESGYLYAGGADAASRFPKGRQAEVIPFVSAEENQGKWVEESFALSRL